jgi:hypothetical protein
MRPAALRSRRTGFPLPGSVVATGELPTRSRRTVFERGDCQPYPLRSQATGHRVSQLLGCPVAIHLGSDQPCEKVRRACRLVEADGPRPAPRSQARDQRAGTLSFRRGESFPKQESISRGGEGTKMQPKRARTTPLVRSRYRVTNFSRVRTKNVETQQSRFERRSLHWRDPAQTARHLT